MCKVLRTRYVCGCQADTEPRPCSTARDYARNKGCWTAFSSSLLDHRSPKPCHKREFERRDAPYTCDRCIERIQAESRRNGPRSRELASSQERELAAMKERRDRRQQQQQQQGYEGMPSMPRETHQRPERFRSFGYDENPYRMEFGQQNQPPPQPQQRTTRTATANTFGARQYGPPPTPPPDRPLPRPPSPAVNDMPESWRKIIPPAGESYSSSSSRRFPEGRSRSDRSRPPLSRSAMANAEPRARSQSRSRAPAVTGAATASSSRRPERRERERWAALDGKFDNPRAAPAPPADALPVRTSNTEDTRRMNREAVDRHESDPQNFYWRMQATKYGGVFASSRPRDRPPPLQMARELANMQTLAPGAQVEPRPDPPYISSARTPSSSSRAPRSVAQRTDSGRRAAPPSASSSKYDKETASADKRGGSSKSKGPSWWKSLLRPGSPPESEASWACADARNIERGG